MRTREGEFSASYDDARDRFRAAAVDRGAALTPLTIAAVGPAGQTLSIDVAWCGPASASRILVHTSGVHGVEGFSGSAIQLQWLETHGPQHIPSDVAVVLVHIVNPYGMACERRVNEHNVDLNRNWLADGEAYTGAPPGYDAVDEFLNGATPQGAVHFYVSAARLVRTFGLPALKQMIASGQYVNPAGLFFGGSQLEEGPALVRAFMHARLSQVKRIVALDVHTGIGAYGKDVLLTTAGSTSHRRLAQTFGDRAVTSDPAGGPAWVSRGLYLRMFHDAAPAAEIDAAIQEFGTFGPFRMLRALRAENWQHHHGSGDPRPKPHLARVFNPSDPEWRAGVILRGRRAIDQAIRSLAVLP